MINQDFFMDYAYEVHYKIYFVNEEGCQTGYNIWNGYLDWLLCCCTGNYRDDGIVYGYAICEDWTVQWKVKNLESMLLELREFDSGKIPEIKENSLEVVVNLRDKLIELVENAIENAFEVFIEEA